MAEAWAAISVSLMLISFVGIAMFEREHLISMLVFSIAFFAFVEAGFSADGARRSWDGYPGPRAPAR